MKRFTLWFTLAIFFALASVAVAQEETTETMMDQYNVYRMTFSENVDVSLEANEDGTYMVGISGIGDQLNSLVVPLLRSETVFVSNFVSSWLGAEEGQARITLQDNELLIEMSLSNPMFDFDTNSIMLDGELISAATYDGAEVKDLPTEFSGAMVISFDFELETSILLGELEQDGLRFYDCTTIPQRRAQIAGLLARIEAGELDFGMSPERLALLVLSWQNLVAEYDAFIAANNC